MRYASRFARLQEIVGKRARVVRPVLIASHAPELQRLSRRRVEVDADAAERVLRAAEHALRRSRTAPLALRSGNIGIFATVFRLSQDRAAYASMAAYAADAPLLREYAHPRHLVFAPFDVEYETADGLDALDMPGRNLVFCQRGENLNFAVATLDVAS